MVINVCLKIPQLGTIFGSSLGIFVTIWKVGKVQSCKNLGSVVAMLQGNFETIINLRQFFRKKRTVLSQLQIRLFTIKID